MAVRSDQLRAAIIRRAFGSDEFIDRNLASFIGGITMMPNNICNADCIFCAYRYNEEPKDTMSLDLFKRALDSTLEMGPVGTVVLTPVAGEPLADPTLFDKIAYATTKGVQRLMFATNGILLLKNDNYKRCIDAGLCLIWLSTARFNAPVYERVYRSKQYSKVLEGILKLLDYKEQRRADVQIKLNIRLDVPLEEAMADPDMALILPFVERGTAELNPRSEFDNWSGHIRESDLIGLMTLNEAKPKPVPCDRMIHDLAVLPDGKVRVCSCRYYKTNHDELVIGDVTEEPMAKIHFGNRHKQLLKNVASGQWPRVCDSCSLYQPVNLPLKAEKAIGRLTASQSMESSIAAAVEPAMPRGLRRYFPWL